MVELKKVLLGRADVTSTVNVTFPGDCGVVHASRDCTAVTTSPDAPVTVIDVGDAEVVVTERPVLSTVSDPADTVAEAVRARSP